MKKTRQVHGCHGCEFFPEGSECDHCTLAMSHLKFSWQKCHENQTERRLSSTLSSARISCLTWRKTSMSWLNAKADKCGGPWKDANCLWQRNWWFASQIQQCEGTPHAHFQSDLSPGHLNVFHVWIFHIASASLDLASAPNLDPMPAVSLQCAQMAWMGHCCASAPQGLLCSSCFANTCWPMKWFFSLSVCQLFAVLICIIWCLQFVKEVSQEMACRFISTIMTDSTWVWIRPLFLQLQNSSKFHNRMELDFVGGLRNNSFVIFCWFHFSLLKFAAISGTLLSLGMWTASWAPTKHFF